MRSIASATTSVVAVLALGLASPLLAGCPKNKGAVDGGALVDGAAIDPTLAVDGAVLPLDAGDVPDAADVDTDVRLPPESSDELTNRARHLLQAIVEDNPDLAQDVMLPRDAFGKLRAESDPSKVYDKKIAPSFIKAVHALHKRTKRIDQAQFVGFEIGSPIDQGTLHSREWKRQVWHARHAKLVVTVPSANGTPVTEKIGLGELVAWRGAWYVLRLHGRS